MCCISVSCDPLGSILVVTVMCGDAATPMFVASCPLSATHRSDGIVLVYPSIMLHCSLNTSS